MFLWVSTRSYSLEGLLLQHGVNYKVDWLID